MMAFTTRFNPRGAVGHRLGRAVAQLAQAVEEHGPRQSVTTLAFIEVGVRTPPQLEVHQPVGHVDERSTRPISRRALLSAFWRGKAAILRKITEGGTVPARIEAASRSTSSQFFSTSPRSTAPPIMEASGP